MKHNTTAHVLLVTDRCIDCGKCIDACPQGVLGRVHILKHKHSHVDQDDLCMGCLKCVKVARKRQ